METGIEEEVYKKVIYIVIGVLAVIVFIILMDTLTGGNLFKSLVCSILWWMPSGSVNVGYLGCGAIPL
jgi:hypothetical protein